MPAVFMLDQAAGTGYVRISNFMNEKVADDLHDALGKLEGKGMTRLILDLRDNGGGSVAEAAHVAGEFLPKGAIVYTSRRAQGRGHRHGARLALVLEERARLSDRTARELRHRECLGARRGRAAGSRSRAHRRPHDVREDRC